MEVQIGSGKIFQSARPAGGWHCSVSSARPYFSRGEAEDWSGLKGRVAEAKFFSQPGRRADGIAQFHPPGHTSAEARGRMGLKGGLAKAKFFYQSVWPAGGSEAFPPASSLAEVRRRWMALLSFIRRTILQPGLAGGRGNIWPGGCAGRAKPVSRFGLVKIGRLQAVKGRMKQTEVYNTQMMCNSTCCIE